MIFDPARAKEHPGDSAGLLGAESQQFAVEPVGVVDGLIPAVARDDLQRHVFADDTLSLQFRQRISCLPRPVASSIESSTRSPTSGGIHRATADSEGDDPHRDVESFRQRCHAFDDVDAFGCAGVGACETRQPAGLRPAVAAGADGERNGRGVQQPIRRRADDDLSQLAVRRRTQHQQLRLRARRPLPAARRKPTGARP